MNSGSQSPKSFAYYAHALLVGLMYLASFLTFIAGNPLLTAQQSHWVALVLLLVTGAVHAAGKTGSASEQQ